MCGCKRHLSLMKTLSLPGVKRCPICTLEDAPGCDGALEQGWPQPAAPKSPLQQTFRYISGFPSSPQLICSTAHQAHPFGCVCHSLGTWVGHPGLASPATALQTLPGKCLPCYSDKKRLMKRHAGNVEARLMLLL